MAPAARSLPFDRSAQAQPTSSTVMEFRDGVLVYNEPGALPPDALAGLIGQVTTLDMGSVHAELASRGGA